MRDAIWIHATALVVRSSGLLIRGRSGAGKSALALALLDRAKSAGWFGCLVGDDRIGVRPVNGRLLAWPHPAIAGRIEQRGSGILDLPYQPIALIRLVVDLATDCDVAPRLPESHALRTTMCGVELARLALPQTMPVTDAAMVVTRSLLPRNFLHCMDG